MTKKRNKLRPNVWRNWREDSIVDVYKALGNDLELKQAGDLSFISDLMECKDVLKNWYHKIQICHLENMAASWNENKKLSTYPRVKKSIIMDQIDNGLNMINIQGNKNSICRGQFINFLLQMAWARNDRPKELAKYLD